MQTKDIIKLPLTTEWIVPVGNTRLPKHAVSNPIRDNVDGTRSLMVQWNYLTKATLVSHDTYEDTSCVSQQVDNAYFVKTTKDRTKRFLVTDGTVYWVVPATNFLGLWSDFEPFYNAQKAEQEAKQQKEEERRKIMDASRSQAQVQVDAITHSLQDSIKDLLGFGAVATANVSIRIDGKWIDEIYDSKVTGEVTLRYDQFQKLLDYAYSGK